MKLTGTSAQQRMRPGYVLSLFSYAHFAEHLCSALLVPLLPFIRDQFGLTYFQSGLLVSAFSITAGLANLPMGWLADRLGTRQVFALGIGGVALASIALGFSASFYQLFLFTILAGLFSGAYHPVSATFLSMIFDIRKLGRAFGLHMVGGSLGMMAAPALGGLLADQLGWRYAFILLALPSLPLVIVFLRLRHGTGPGETAQPRPAGQVASSPKSSLTQMIRPIALLMFLVLAIQLISMGLTSLLPVYLVDRRQISPAVAAMLLALIRGGGVVGAPLGGFICDHIGRKPGILVSIMAVGPLLLLAVATPMGAGLLTVLLFLGIATQMKQPAVQSMLVEAVPSGRRSTLLGIYFFSPPRVEV